MRNFEVSEEFQYPSNFGGVPNALPSLAAVKSQSQTCVSPALSSFLGSASPSSLQGVDCSPSQIYNPQAQYEELAFWQSLQKQQINLEPPESQLPQQRPKFMEPPDHSQLPHQHPKFMETPVSHHSQMLQQHLKFMENPVSCPSQLPQQHLKFIEPPVSFPSQLPEQHLKFMEPQLKSSHQHNSMDPPRTHPSQLQQQHLNFTEHPLKRGDQQLSQNVLQAISSAPLESQSQQLFLPAPVTINLDKSASKQVEDVSQKPRLVASCNVPRKDPFKDKEKETSSSTEVQRLMMPPTSQPLGVELSRNWGSLNQVHSVSPVLDNRRHTLPPRSDIRRQKEDYSGLNALIELVHALQACSPPSSDIPDPFRETAGPLFDIPFFSKNTGSSETAGSLGNLRSLPLAHNEKDLQSRKGKQVVTKRKRK